MRMTRLAFALALAAAVLAGCGGNGGPGETAAGGGRQPAADLRVSTAGWKTDFSRHSVPLDEFLGGGPGKDGIPAIDRPRFVAVREADRFLDDPEAVAVLELGGKVKAYPIRILTWHEIVNDRLAGRPISVTYCPLCNSTVAFSREVGGRVLDFGTTGNLRNSDLIMYDRETESWWQQITADAVVGELTGTRLKVLPSQIVSWARLKRTSPDARVLSTNTGFSRSYGDNPYAGYDSDPDSRPFLLDSEPDRSLPPKERVAAVRTGRGAAVVYPFARLRREAPVNDTLPQRSVVGGRPVVVLFDPDLASPLDDSLVSEGRSVGTAAVFSRATGGRTLTFERGPGAGTFRDRQTGSTWDISGRATAGPLRGERLRQIASDDQFWFALAAFFPKADIRR
jgi:hypothetical protein